MSTSTTKPGKVYIGLGSNIEQPFLQIKQAILALESLPGTRVLADSGYYTSKPMGPEDQPDYVNAVIEIETVLEAKQLLNHCQLIEQQQGRVKKRHWGERTIDLDILLFADQQIAAKDLTIPHPGICQRDFVYLPLLKLNPEVEIPGKGMLNAMVESCVESATGLTTEVNSDYSCRFAGPICRDY
ncbi:MAG: 2-amino-4-hydroxy-6-hydroxymethyldihydropteridine diphosphokinase [Gammaproteobacteria bacterium]|nr:2-amino-4-hydroxy-6-hydroxymethyldihydropteridine diphosphokinase [Gammaproteobacteria bacterium]